MGWRSTRIDIEYTPAKIPGTSGNQFQRVADTSNPPMPSLTKTNQATSTNDGSTWTNFHSLSKLTGANCQQSIVGVPPAANAKETGSSSNWTLALSFPTNISTRAGMTVWRSADAQAWSMEEMLYQGPAAYSAVTVVPAPAHPSGRALLCLYERGNLTKNAKRDQPGEPAWADYSVELSLATIPLP
jgi:hypothetical protein